MLSGGTGCPGVAGSFWRPPLCTAGCGRLLLPVFHLFLEMARALGLDAAALDGGLACRVARHMDLRRFPNRPLILLFRWRYGNCACRRTISMTGNPPMPWHFGDS